MANQNSLCVYVCVCVCVCVPAIFFQVGYLHIYVQDTNQS